MLLLLATPDPDVPALEPKVEEAIQANLEERKAAFWKECRTAAVEQASRFVDSMLLVQAPWTSEDSLLPPPRPERPLLDSARIEVDTTPLRPILPVDKKIRSSGGSTSSSG